MLYAKIESPLLETWLTTRLNKTANILEFTQYTHSKNNDLFMLRYITRYLQLHE